MLTDLYKDPYGTWSVSTEGDVEGRTTRQLGVFEGYADEIALHLANQCHYSLQFKKIQGTKGKKLPASNIKVSVSFDYSAGVSSNSGDPDVIKEVAEVFKDRPVHVSRCNYYGAFTITSTNPDDIKRQQALAKLTDEEKKLLGL